MSFPKARILRFNEISTCAPPPGKYDPKYDVKVKGAFITKSERFVDKLEPTPSEASEDSASTCSNHCHPPATFRTPQLPKKRIPLTPRSASSCNRTAQTPERKTKKRLEYETEKNLIHQINELTRVHSAQLIEKDRELAMMQREMEEIKAAYTKSENSHINDYNVMKQRYESEILRMKSELSTLIGDIEHDKLDAEKIVTELQTQLTILEENVLNCNVINRDLECKLEDANAQRFELSCKFENVIEELERTNEKVQALVEEKKSHLLALDDIPVQLDRAWETAVSNFASLSKPFEDLLSFFEQEVENESQALNQSFSNLIDDITSDVKDQVKCFEQSATTLQETIKMIVDDVDVRVDELHRSFGQSSEVLDAQLKVNLSLIEELETSKEARLREELAQIDLQYQIRNLKNEVDSLSHQNKKFEVVHKEAIKTIEILSGRLVESENEVERLNDKTEEFCLRKDALEEKVRSVVDENNLLKIEIATSQMSTVKQIKQIETDLLNKVEQYRRVAAQQAQQFTEESTAKQQVIDALTLEAEFNHTKIAEMNECLVECQAKLNEYHSKVEDLKTKLYKAVDEVASVETSKEQIQLQLQSVLADKDELNAQILSLQTEKAETQRMYDERLEELQLQLDATNNKYSSKISKLSKEVDELTESSKGMTETIVEKDLKLEAVQMEMEELKKLSGRFAHEIPALREEKGRLSQEYVKMKEMYEEECQRREEQEKDNLKYIGELVSDLMLEKQRCSEVNLNLEEKIEEIARLEVEIRDGENKNDELLEQVENLERTIATGNNDKSTLEFRILELEKLLQTEIEGKEAVVKEKDDMLEILKRQWEEHELLVNQIECQQEEIVELKQMRDEAFEEEKAIHQAELQNEIFALQQNLEDTQQHAINLKAREDELIFKLSSTEAEVVAAESAKRQYETQLKEVEEKMASLEAKCSVVTKRKEEYKLYAAELEAEKNSLKMSVEEKEKMLEDKEELSARIASLESRLAEVQSKYSDAEREIVELRAKNAALESIIQPFREQLLRFEKEKNDLLFKSESTEKEMKDLAIEHAKLLSHHNHRQKIHRVIQLTETIHDLKKENEKLLKENTKLKATINSKEVVAKRCVSPNQVGKENSAPEPCKKGVHSSKTNSQPASPLKTRNAQ